MTRLPKRVPGATGHAPKPVAPQQKETSATMSVPTVGELLAAMTGSFDPQHPCVDILRTAWLLSKTGDFFKPKEILAVQIDRQAGTITHLENGADAMQQLGVEIPVLIDDVFIARITNAVNGHEEYAMAVAQLASAWSYVCSPRIWWGHCNDEGANERLAEACTEYEQVAAKLPQPPAMPAITMQP
jgi:hypothetical protein